MARSILARGSHGALRRAEIMKILLDTHRFRRAGIGVQPVGDPQRDWAGRVRTQVIIAQNSQATPVIYDPDQYVLPRGCTLETMRPQKFSE